MPVYISLGVCVPEYVSVLVPVGAYVSIVGAYVFSLFIEIFRISRYGGQVNSEFPPKSEKRKKELFTTEKLKK